MNLPVGDNVYHGLWCASVRNAQEASAKAVRALLSSEVVASRDDLLARWPEQNGVLHLRDVPGG